jgi:hypothetical protein
LPGQLRERLFLLDDRIEQLPRFFRSQGWSLSFIGLQLRGADWFGGVGLQDLPGRQKVEETPEGGEVLLHSGGRPVVFLDIGGDVDRLNIG